MKTFICQNCQRPFNRQCEKTRKYLFCSRYCRGVSERGKLSDVWAKIGIPSDYSVCWEWSGAKNKGGYGNMAYCVGGKRRHILAHRAVWEYLNGEIPPGKVIMHTCDNQSCCNPEHLRLGTQRDNMRDCLAKHRFPTRRGEQNNAAILKDADIPIIRKRLVDGEFQRLVASDYDVSENIIGKIARRETWTHIL